MGQEGGVGMWGGRIWEEEMGRHGGKEVRGGSWGRKEGEVVGKNVWVGSWGQEGGERKMGGVGGSNGEVAPASGGRSA